MAGKPFEKSGSKKSQRAPNQQAHYHHESFAPTYSSNCKVSTDVSTTGRKRKRNRDGSTLPSCYNVVFDRSSKRQWKALMLCYPIYGKAAKELGQRKDESSDAADKVRDSEKRENNVDRKFFLPPYITTGDWEYFMEHVVDFFLDAFRLERTDEGERQKQDQRRRRRGGKEEWRYEVPKNVDTVLGQLFGLDPPFVDNAENPLTLALSEHLLLHLWDKERARVDSYYRLYLYTHGELTIFREEQHLHETTTKDGHPPVTRVNGEILPFAYPALPPSTASTKEDVLEETEVQGRMMEREKEFVAPRRRPPPTLSPPSSPILPKVSSEFPVSDHSDMICDHCFETGGDLFRCAHCQCLRHELCGGPHPPHAQQGKKSKYTDTEGAAPLMLCEECKREGSQASGSSSLRSSTSEDERDELGSIGLDEDDTSSLSGFIVRSSEEDEATEEDDERDKKRKKCKSKRRSPQCPSTPETDYKSARKQKGKKVQE